MNDTTTEVIGLDQVDYHPQNDNVHSETQLRRLRESLERYGYVKRFVAQRKADGRFLCLAGEGIVKALRQSGWTEAEATIVPADWTPELAWAYLWDDNHLASKNQDPLKEIAMFQALAETPERPTGLSEIEEMRILDLINAEAQKGEEPPDHDPELPADRVADMIEDWGVERGQIWRIGPHFVACGDSTDPRTWEILMAAASVQPEEIEIMITSPPYADQRKGRYESVSAEDFVDWYTEGIEPQMARWLSDSGSFFLNLKAATVDGRRLTYDKRLVLALEELGWIYFEEFCWEKPGRPGSYKKRFKNAWEPVHHFVRSTEALRDNTASVYEDRSEVVKASWRGLAETQGLRGASRKPGNQPTVDQVRPSNVLRIQHDVLEIEGGNHPGRFPVKLPSFFVRAYSYPGDWIMDFFAGTGSTLIAAHSHERRGLGIDYEPSSIAQLLERFRAVTGLTGERLV